MPGSWDMRLVTASYRREGPEELPVIQLFGRTREGRAMVAEYWGFEPYFFCVEPSPGLLEYLRRDPEVRRTEEVQLLVEGRERRCARVVLHHPWRTPEMRQKCRAQGSEILAADIPFGQRFVFDKDLGSCVRVHGEETKGNYTTDLVVKAEDFENIEAFAPALKVLSFDVEQSLRDGRILVIGTALRREGALETLAFTGGEKEILQAFLDFIKREDPDAITGYNIDGFDIPVLISRAKAMGLEGLPIARDFKEPIHIGERFWRFHGRIIADAWWSAKKELRPKRETLHDVAQLLGLEKVGIVGIAVVEKRSKRAGAPEQEERPIFIGSNVDEFWEREPKTVIEYCKNDAAVALEILERVASLDKAMDLATVSRLPLDDVFNGRTSTLIDSILIRAADRAAVGVPMMKVGGGGEAESIEGGYVHSIQPGLYEWVDVVDYRSQYPNIIIEKNICFTTLSPQGTVVSPTGARFLSPDRRVGLLPHILEDLMRWREETRVKMRAAKSPEKRDYYDRLQAAIKILTNAFYGVLASTFYRFTNLEIGASITAFARENIKALIKRLEEQEGVKVIYSDSVLQGTPLLCKSSSGIAVKRIENVKCGDWVVDERGWTEVKQVIRKEVEKRFFRVETWTGVVEITEDHSLVDNKGHEISPKDCKVGDALGSPKIVLDMKEDIDKEEAWLLGYFVADGTAKKYEWFKSKPKREIQKAWQSKKTKERGWKDSKTGIHFDGQRKDLLFRAQGTLRTIGFDSKINEWESNRTKGGMVYRLNVLSPLRSGALNYFRQCYDGDVKAVPVRVLNAGNEVARSFVEGYLAGDGGNKNKEGIWQADDVAEVVYGIGILARKASMRFRYSSYNGQRGLKRYLRNIRFLRDEGDKRLKRDDEIRKIEDLGVMKAIVYDLETESHHFEAGGVLLHNTDSTFFESPKKDLQGALALGRRISEEYSKGGPPLQFERVLETFFSHGKKKRYAGKSVWPDEAYIFRGYEVRRTDAFDLQIRGQQAVLERVLERDVDGAVKLAKEIVRRTAEGQVPLEDLVISRTVKEEESYVNPESMSNVQAARKLEALGYEFTSGMKVSWVVTNGKKRPQEVEPYIAGQPFKGVPDYAYYTRRLAQTLGYVTEVFGWDDRSLLTGSTQATLFGENVGADAPRPPPPRRAEKPVRLEDFF